VLAVDFSAVALAKGRQLAMAFRDGRERRIQWSEADVLDYRPEPGNYDVVLMSYLHLPSDERRLVLRRAVESLVPGGELLVIGHDSTNLTDGTGGPQDPLVLFTPGEVVADLARCGTAVRIKQAERYLRSVKGAHRQAIDAVIRAIRPGI
jgi:SAM-dependent methyltransferase